MFVVAHLKVTEHCITVTSKARQSSFWATEALRSAVELKCLSNTTLPALAQALSQPKVVLSRPTLR